MTSSLLQEANTIIKSYIEKGAGPIVSAERYSQSGPRYEEIVGVVNYHAPSHLARVMSELFPRSIRENISILDVAAGTGLSGLKLHEAGFRKLDGVDPAQGMLDVAREKNIYGRLICAYVDDSHQLDIPDNTYDAVTIAGAMGENMLPYGAFGEMIRVTKPGGVIVNVARAESFVITDDYKGKIEPYFRKLEADGKWKEESRTIFEDYQDNLDGIAVVHRVLS